MHHENPSDIMLRGELREVHRGITAVCSPILLVPQNRPIKAIDPSKTIPVVVNGVGPVPGALVWPDMDTDWHMANLGSRVLGLCEQRVVGDWEGLFGHRVLLMETLVDAQRVRGTVYRAA